MDVYDVTDCADPVLLETFRWPESIHNLTLSGDGRYVFGTQPLQVAGTTGAQRTAPASLAVDARPAWCTLGPLAA
jgi:hypothetical protein